MSSSTPFSPSSSSSSSTLLFATDEDQTSSSLTPTLDFEESQTTSPHRLPILSPSSISNPSSSPKLTFINNEDLVTSSATTGIDKDKQGQVNTYRDEIVLGIEKNLTKVNSDQQSQSFHNKTQPFPDFESNPNPLSQTTSSHSSPKSFLYSLIFSHAGVKLLILAQVFNSAMIAFTRLLETSSDPPFHPFQILFARMFITYIGCALFITINTIKTTTTDTTTSTVTYRQIFLSLLGPPEVRVLLALRGILGFFGVFGLYYSVNYLELSDAAVITFLTPTVTAIFAWWLLNEKLTVVEVVGGCVALAGVLVISRPAFVFGVMSKTGDTNSDGSSATTHSPVPEHMRIRAVLVALLGVCGASSVYIIIRKIGLRAHPLVSVSYFSMWTLIVSTLGLLVTPGLGFILPQSAWQWTLLLLLGVFGFLFQFCLTAGIQRVSAGRAAAATYTLMIWTLGWEKVVWNKTPDWMSIMGSSLILGSGIVVAVYKWWDGKKKEEKKEKERRGEEGYESESESQDEDDYLLRQRSNSKSRYSFDHEQDIPLKDLKG